MVGRPQGLRRQDRRNCTAARTCYPEHEEPGLTGLVFDFKRVLYGAAFFMLRRVATATIDLQAFPSGVGGSTQRATQRAREVI
jgi:hypothetical protein